MASEGRGRRIVDFLNDGEELGIEEGGSSAAVTPLSPALAAARSLLPRFRWARMASRIGRKGAGGKGKGKGKEVVAEEIAVEEKGEPAAVASTSGASSVVELVVVLVSLIRSKFIRFLLVCESHSHTRTPDLGVGLSLVFLLAKTSDEFNKMVKVRAEMETLLREIKDQVRQSSGIGDASETCRNLESAASSCLTDTNENERATAHMEDQATSSNMEELSCEKSTEYERFPRMDVLEEEFHAELDLLQVNYGSDVQLFLPEEHDEERRLHELLHQRNQERIEELELALKRAEKKLVEKEMEVSMWKDTAKLALRQDSSMSCTDY
ncbi:hypothetical protein E2562_019152 [Oryza meyeriana var. granulata]|uniref:Protein POLAR LOCALIZATION DURING ASYMMETRIC DIVISION AND REDISTRIBUTION n=1 Tax=Oryza meyeriana var. granulata TaxID=110450 RepID=A0A6G1CRS6_9ORYZ|nr:hypothetical protein E2562_019152 [Oryza meyeriana var. granulata]